MNESEPRDKAAEESGCGDPEDARGGPGPQQQVDAHGSTVEDKERIAKQREEASSHWWKSILAVLSQHVVYRLQEPGARD